MAELDTASKCTALRPRARSRRRHWYCHQFGTCLCGIRQRCCGREI